MSNERERERERANEQGLTEESRTTHMTLIPKKKNRIRLVISQTPTSNQLVLKY